MRTRFAVFACIFIALNLAFIPLLGAYGLSVCPVLRLYSFFTGCSYSALFVILVCGLNLSALAFQLRKKSRLSPWIPPLFYLIATGLSLMLLQKLLGLNHSSAESRAPQILILASVLLGITQHYGMLWVQEEGRPTSANDTGINSAWARHSFRIFLPVLSAVVILLHFVATQSKMAELSFSTIGSIIRDTRVLILFTLGWMLTTFVFLFLSERDSVKKISLLLEKIKDGSPGPEILIPGWGLWNYLGRTLRNFAKAMSERERLLNSFSRFVSKEVASRALGEEIRSVGGNRVPLTIIMTDIRGFSGISETLPPEKVISFLNEYFDLVIRIFLDHQIHIDKFIGDGILAYVLPEGKPESENARAILALNQLLDQLPNLNGKYRELGLPELRIGGGITRGEVIRGMIGSSNRLEHTIIGDPVNRAARLEALTKEFGVDVIITHDVYTLCESSLVSAYRNLGKSKLKGMELEYDVFGR